MKQACSCTLFHVVSQCIMNAYNDWHHVHLAWFRTVWKLSSFVQLQKGHYSESQRKTSLDLSFLPRSPLKLVWWLSGELDDISSSSPESHQTSHQSSHVRSKCNVVLLHTAVVPIKENILLSHEIIAIAVHIKGKAEKKCPRFEDSSFVSVQHRIDEVLIECREHCLVG